MEERMCIPCSPVNFFDSNSDTRQTFICSVQNLSSNNPFGRQAITGFSDKILVTFLKPADYSDWLTQVQATYSGGGNG